MHSPAQGSSPMTRRRAKAAFQKKLSVTTNRVLDSCTETGNYSPDLAAWAAQNPGNGLSSILSPNSSSPNNLQFVSNRKLYKPRLRSSRSGELSPGGADSPAGWNYPQKRGIHLGLKRSRSIRSTVCKSMNTRNTRASIDFSPKSTYSPNSTFSPNSTYTCSPNSTASPCASVSPRSSNERLKNRKREQPDSPAMNTFTFKSTPETSSEMQTYMSGFSSSRELAVAMSKRAD